MKRSQLLICVALFLIMSTISFAQNIQTITLPTGFLDQERAVLISLPDSYLKSVDKRYEVVYVFDAQGPSYFDVVHSSLRFLQPAGCEYIVVGVPSPYYSAEYHRYHDFLPESNHAFTKIKYGTGNVEGFLDFLELTVFPAIESTYRTAPHRIGIGHSNGGTFLSYTLTTRTALFDTIIAISPNYSFDEGQIADRIAAFNPARIDFKKFIFLSHGIEEAANGWRPWEIQRERVYATMRNEKWKSHIHLAIDNFPGTTHQGTYPIGVTTGLTQYFKFQYDNFENLVSHLNKMKSRDSRSIDAEKLNFYALHLFNKGDKLNALQLLSWANQLFPNDLKTYENLGNAYFKMNDKVKARNYYDQYASTLESIKDSLPENQYDQQYSIIQERLRSL